ncbi:hypothetical protein NV63_11110 [Elizabethkingia anophelis]|nr:hypothetical protein NV63_11110 [Elizabethkingia anophelis]
MKKRLAKFGIRGSKYNKAIPHLFYDQYIIIDVYSGLCTNCDIFFLFPEKVLQFLRPGDYTNRKNMTIHRHYGN